MRHAILIMAHRDIDHLCHLIEYFCRNCDVFIHLDAKAGLGDGIVDRLRGYAQVCLVSREYGVNWGGTSVLDSELALLSSAYEYERYDYFHLLSGQDYPVKPLNYFLDYFERNRGKEFLQWVPIPNPQWERNTYRRFQYFYPYDVAQEHENPRQWVMEQVHEQERKGLRRPIPDEFNVLYGSSQWFSITGKAAKVLLDYTHNCPAFRNRLWMTFAPEECYVATVLLNLLDQQSVVHFNCRFIRWRYENGNRPANLGQEHFRHLMGPDILIARKFDERYSQPLVSLIDKYLVNENDEIVVSDNGGWDYDGYLRYEYDWRFCEFVSGLCADSNVRTAVDIGCGTGYYVAHWRKCGLSFAGYDANPHTRRLSQRLLDDDVPCGVADLTADLSDADVFELVVCKDVLSYIPVERLELAVSNLSRLSSWCVIVSWYVSEIHQGVAHHTLDESEVRDMFGRYGLVPDRIQTNRLRKVMSQDKCLVLVRNTIN